MLILVTKSHALEHIGELLRSFHFSPKSSSKAYWQVLKLSRAQFIQILNLFFLFAQQNSIERTIFFIEEDPTSWISCLLLWTLFVIVPQDLNRLLSVVSICSRSQSMTMKYDTRMGN